MHATNHLYDAQLTLDDAFKLTIDLRYIAELRTCE